MQPQCSIPDCANPIYARGWCRKHWNRWYRHGSTEMPPRPSTRKHPLYVVWMHMIQRCHWPDDPSWPNYGGRGITVCDRWRTSFTAFLADMGERPPNPEGWTSEKPYYSIDRIDNDGNYEPGNCRWSTRSEQARNKRPLTHCKRGHEFTPENTYVNPSGRRHCRICRHAYHAKERSR